MAKSKLDLDNIKRTYFFIDKPVPYELKDGNTIEIKPIRLIDSEFFLSSADVLSINKNSLNSVDIIQMSYLKFLFMVAFSDKNNIHRLVNILMLSCGIKLPKAALDDKKHAILIDEATGIKITEKEFDDIKTIILHQNFINYDEDYVDPYLKRAMERQDNLAMKKFEPISLERKIAIISAHTGITKQEQLEMTYRSHSMLFNEVCGEVRYSVSMPIALVSGDGDKVEDWIYKKKQGKFDKYVTTLDEFGKQSGISMGAIKTKVSSQINDEFMDIK